MSDTRILGPQFMNKDARLQGQLAQLEARLRNLEAQRAGFIITNIITAVGPLPLTGLLTTFGGRLLLIASGSGFTSAAPISGEGMNVQIGGTTVVTDYVGINVNGVHAALPMVSWGPTVPSGSSPLTIGLTATTNFTTDANDRFTVIAIELL